jgi:hypothetical protein
MRTKNSIINVLTNCSSYFILIITSFFIRRIFASIFGLEFVGIDGAFLNVVSILSIVESGLGTGMIYKLYQPIAVQDYKKISSMLKFLRNAYAVISVLIFFFGAAFSFFAAGLVKESFSKIWLTKIFMLYISDTTASYLFFYKRVMFMADQKSYVNNAVKIVLNIAVFISQMLILYFLRSFEIYLIIKIFYRIFENILISHIFNKNYNFLDIKNAAEFSGDERKEVFSGIKGMIFHKIGGASLKQISGIIILLFASLKENGIYYNYMLIVSALLGISGEFFNGIIASFGNFLHTENTNKIEENFNTIFFINFLIYSFFSSAFFNIITPFTKLWINSPDCIFPAPLTVIITVYLYVYGMKQSLDMAKSGAGIYFQDRFFPVLEAAANFVLSFFLAKKFGIGGAVFGAVLAAVCVPFFSQPYFFYKIVFNSKPNRYYKKYLIYTSASLISVFLPFFLIKFFNFNSLILQIIVNFVICLIITNLLNIILFCRTKEFEFLNRRFLRKKLKL